MFNLKDKRQAVGTQGRVSGGCNPVTAQGLPLRSPQVAIKELGGSRQRCGGSLRPAAQQGGRHLLGMGRTAPNPNRANP